MSEIRRPITVVDLVILSLVGGKLAVVLTRRRKPPYEGRLALPGGYVHVDEDRDLTATARRVLRDKTGLTAPYLEQLQTFSGAVRDPRGWSISIAYFALVRESDLDNRHDTAVLVDVDALPDLPFDHGSIVQAALQRVRNKSSYSTLPAFLLPDEFTISELQTVYEQVIGDALSRTNFRRYMEDQGIVVAAPGRQRMGAHRPAQMYRLANAALRAFDRVL